MRLDYQNKKNWAIFIGKTDKIKIVEVDKSKFDNCMLFATALETVDGDLYCLGIKEETLPQLFPQNQFTECEKNLFKSVIITENIISILTSGIENFFDYWTRCTC